MSIMSTKSARLLVVESSCYVNQASKVACSGEQLLFNQTSKIACSGEQLLRETNDRFAMRS